MTLQRHAQRAVRARTIPVLAIALLLAVLATPAIAAPPPSPAAITSVAPPVLAAAASANAAGKSAVPRRFRAARFARSQTGKPYRWGGSGPRGYDCSGLTQAAWARGGKKLPHSSRMQAGVTRRVPRSNIKVGDLLFYGKPVSHVAIYVGNGKMVEAPRRGLKVRKITMRRRGLVKIGRP